MPNDFPISFPDATVLMATFAYDHFEPSKRFLCILLATGNSAKPRWISISANNDETASDYLIIGAKLSPPQVNILLHAAKKQQELFENQAREFIPAGKPR